MTHAENKADNARLPSGPAGPRLVLWDTMPLPRRSLVRAGRWKVLRGTSRKESHTGIGPRSSSTLPWTTMAFRTVRVPLSLLCVDPQQLRRTNCAATVQDGPTEVLTLTDRTDTLRNLTQRQQELGQELGHQQEHPHRTRRRSQQVSRLSNRSPSTRRCTPRPSTPNSNTNSRLRRSTSHRAGTPPPPPTPTRALLPRHKRARLHRPSRRCRGTRTREHSSGLSRRTLAGSSTNTAKLGSSSSFRTSLFAPRVSLCLKLLSHLRLLRGLFFPSALCAFITGLVNQRLCALLPFLRTLGLFRLRKSCLQPRDFTFGGICAFAVTFCRSSRLAPEPCLSPLPKTECILNSNTDF